MLPQTVHHGLPNSELEVASARILEFLQEDQILTVFHDCGRTPPGVDSANKVHIAQITNKPKVNFVVSIVDC